MKSLHLPTVYLVSAAVVVPLLGIIGTLGLRLYNSDQEGHVSGLSQLTERFDLVQGNAANLQVDVARLQTDTRSIMDRLNRDDVWNRDQWREMQSRQGRVEETLTNITVILGRRAGP